MSIGSSPPAASSIEPGATGTTAADARRGLRKNGKNWHASKSAFRPASGLTSYAKRMASFKAAQATKAVEREMREERAAERDRRVRAIKDRRRAKEEKERYEKMAEKLHRKVVERRKRREKRNKLLKSGK